MKQGFTLIEIIIVVAIIGILATAIIVMISWTRTDALDAERISAVRATGLAFRVEQDQVTQNFPSFNALVTVPTSTIAAMPGVAVANPDLGGASFCISYELIVPEIGEEIYLADETGTNFRDLTQGGC